MKTKSFLLATAGSTVDGRIIDDKLIGEMANSYDVATYGARVNMEHIRGYDPEGAFGSHGDLLELSTGDVDVNFNGKSEKRLGLYGVFEMHDSAKQLNDAGQKVYPSIEIEPDFGGKGFAYCMGVALTDSPAAIATERLQFSRAYPGIIQLSAKDSSIEGALIEFADPAVASDPAVGGFFAAATDFFKGMTPDKPEQKPAESDGDKSVELLSKIEPLFTAFGTKMDTAFAAQTKATNAAVEKVDARCTELSKKIDTTGDPNQQDRSQSDDDNQFKAQC